MRNPENLMQYEDFQKFCDQCVSEAELPFCVDCGGTGEVWERFGWDEEQEDLVVCSTCNGRG